MILSPIKIKDALERFSQKEIAPIKKSAKDWALVENEIKQRAFFSANVESARFLQGAKNFIQDFLDEKQETLPDGRKVLKAGGRAAFIDKFLKESEPLGLSDVMTPGRLKLVFDTQIDFAYEDANYEKSMDSDVLYHYPAWRFVRLHSVLKPRNYHQKALGKVALKTDTAFWLSLNKDFKIPRGPWGYNSGCGVEEVSREECIKLGLIDKDYKPKPIKPSQIEPKASSKGLDEEFLKIFTIKLHKNGFDVSVKNNKILASIEKAGELVLKTSIVKNIIDKPDVKTFEPAITNDLKSISKNNNAKLTGLKHKFKSEKSINEKIKRDKIEDPSKTDDEIKNSLFDLVRYTQMSSLKKIANNSKKTLKDLESKGYKIHKFKNFWENESSTYKGINVQIISPDKQKFELQFHDPYNLKIKEEMHKIYELERMETNLEKKEALKKKMKEISKKYKIPPNINNLLD